VAGLAPEAEDILGAHLGLNTCDDAWSAADRGRVEAAAEEAFFRTLGFDALPRPVGRQLFAAGLQSTPGRAAAPLALDGVAGLKTRAGFTRILESIGPDRMARDIAERLRRT